jgi:hypothetical protein
MKTPSLERGLSLQPLDRSLVHGFPVCCQDRPHFDGDLVNRSRKRCWDLVVLCHRGRQVLTDIRPFIPGKYERLGSRDPAFGKLGAAQRNPPNPACSRLPPVISEIEPENVLSRGQRIAGGDFATEARP